MVGSVVILAASSGKNYTLANKFCDTFTEKGVNSEVVDLTKLDWPLYTPETEKNPNVVPETTSLSDLILDAGALVVCAPEYNGVMPPVLHNCIDRRSVQRDDFRLLFNNKTVLLATHSGGGGAHCLMAMRQQFSFLGSNVIGRSMTLNKSKEFSQSTMDDLVTRVMQ